MNGFREKALEAEVQDLKAQLGRVEHRILEIGLGFERRLAISEARADKADLRGVDLDRQLTRLKERGALIENILRSSSDCIQVLDLESRLLFMSDGGKAIMEIDEIAPFIGCPWSDFWHDDGKALAADAIAEAKAGRIARFQGAAPTARGSPRWWDVVVSPVHDEAGHLIQLLSISRDVTATRSLEEALRANDTRLRLAQKAGHIGVFEIDIASDEIVVSPEFCEIFGLDQQPSFTATDVEALIVEERRPAHSRRADREAGTSVRDVEYRVRRASDGAIVDIVRNADFQYGSDGRPVKFVGVVQDVTERKEVQQRQRLLMEEMSHRVKNMLSMVQAIAFQTLRTTAEPAALKAFDDRLLALAGAHDVLLQHRWDAAGLKDLVEGVLGHNADLDRIRVTGPDVQLGPKATLSLALLMHELATNATKHGALSVPGGEVTIEWEVIAADAPLLRLNWTERGGPPVSSPSRKGFGSMILRMGLAGAGHADLDYAAAGLHARFEAPVSMIER